MWSSFATRRIRDRGRPAARSRAPDAVASVWLAVIAGVALLLVATALYVRWRLTDPVGRLEARLVEQMDFENRATCQTLGFAADSDANATCRVALARAQTRYLWRRAEVFEEFRGGLTDVPLPATRDVADR